MRVMICLGQGGLRSLSASSCYCYYYTCRTITCRISIIVFKADRAWVSGWWFVVWNFFGWIIVHLCGLNTMTERITQNIKKCK